nr:hypothetical protein [Candidatus Sigynarchaeota archaeon]
MEHKNEIPSNLLESMYRTGISRVYYGILHWVQMQYKISIPKAELTRYHSWIVKELKNIADDEVLLEFNFLRDARIDADYELRKIIDERLIQQCMESKNRLIKAIKEQPRISLQDDDDRFFRAFRRKDKS